MLSDQLKTLLATYYHHVIKTQFRHWNVTGASFIQLHEFFGAIYADAYSSIDIIAEEIRSLGSNAPGSFTRFNELSILEDQTQIPRAKIMIEEQLADNETIISLLHEVFHTAEEEDAQDVANYISERLAAENKWNWQLKSLLDRDGGEA